MYKDYPSTLNDLVDIVDEYDRARADVDSPEYLKSVCDHYEETRRSLDRIQRRYHKARQQIESSSEHYTDLVSRSQRIVDDYQRHSCMREIDEASYFLRRHPDCLYGSRGSADRSDKEYADMIQWLNESYLPEKKPSIEDHQHLAMRNKEMITTFHRHLQETHKNLRAAESDNERFADLARHASHKLRSSAKETVHRSQHQMRALLVRMEHVEELAREERAKPSKNKFQTIAEQTKEEDLELVRHVIAQQHFDGLWNVDDATTKKLTGKSINEFEQVENSAVLTTAIVILVFEGRFASLSVLWLGVVQKERQRLTNILNNEPTQLDHLLGKIRKQLE